MSIIVYSAHSLCRPRAGAGTSVIFLCLCAGLAIPVTGATSTPRVFFGLRSRPSGL